MILGKFHGGLQLPRHKTLSTQTGITELPTPPQLILPLQQHIGHPATPVVKIGDYVYKGQMLAKAEDTISAPVHATSSGQISAIENRPVPHPSGIFGACIVIDTDGQDRWQTPPTVKQNPLSQSAQTLHDILLDKGIVGMGGAMFPTHIKLSPGPQTHIDTLIINAAECEPYITCDDMLLRAHSSELLCGAVIMRHILHVKHIIIGIESDMTHAYQALQTALASSNHDNIEIRAIPSIYPTGGEKQLIKVLTDRVVPSGGLPAQIGVICHNVGTAYAVYQAIVYDTPLLSRIVTITGEGIAQPCNVLAPIGTPIDFILAHLGGVIDNPHIVIGGPMMGFSLPSVQAPIVKGVNCVLLQPPQPRPQAMPCIRCGKCAEACPIFLLPQQMYWYAKAKNMDTIQNYNLFDCIECGCCSYVCPSHIPLVHYFRFAKTTIWHQEWENNQADQARRRHEARLTRIEKQKAEVAARRKKKQAVLKKPAGDTGVDPKKAAIEAALARVKAQKTKPDAAPKNTQALTDAQQKQIEEVDTRRQSQTKE